MNLCKKFRGRVQERNGPIIVYCERSVFLGDESDIRAVDASQAYFSFMKGLTEIVKILSNDPPTMLQEFSIKTIRTRRFMIGQISN
jgi:hypothetical protein